MKKMYEKMKDYVKMEDEISTVEFSQYYQTLMEELQKNFETMDQETLLQGKLMTAIVAGNSATRKGRKNTDAKKYKKMHEKSLFWSEAIEYRLKQSGMTSAEIEAKTDEMEAAL